MPKVSVIMPVYNSEDYLKAAIQSVINQTFMDWELLLVDDGSRDNSGRLCDQYAEGDSRIRVFHQENGGIAKARNMGLLEARGEYVSFIDNDDVYDAHMLEKCVQSVQGTDADFLKCGVSLKSYDRENRLCKLSERGISKKMDIPEEEISKDYFDLKDSLLLNTVWNGIYRKSFLSENRIQFRDSVKWGYDDQIFNIDLFKYAKRVIVIPEKLYTWTIRKNHSRSQVMVDERLDEIYEVYKSERDLVCNCFSGYADSNQWYARMGYYIRYSIVVLAKMDGMPWSVCKEKIGMLYRYPILRFNCFVRALPALMRKPEHLFVILLLLLRMKKLALALTRIYLSKNNKL